MIKIFKYIKVLNQLLIFFFKIVCTTNKTNCYKFTKVINYSEYIDTYYKFHEKISLHYGDISYLTFNNNIGIIQDFINCMDENNLKIKTSSGESKKNALINTLSIFEKVGEQNYRKF